MRSVLPLSFITVICHVLLSLDFLVGPVAAIGQETSPLPDAPKPNQTQSGQSSPEQDGQQDGFKCLVSRRFLGVLLEE